MAGELWATWRYKDNRILNAPSRANTFTKATHCQDKVLLYAWFSQKVNNYFCASLWSPLQLLENKFMAVNPSNSVNQTYVFNIYIIIYKIVKNVNMWWPQIACFVYLLPNTPKDVQFIIMKEKEKKQILTIEKLELGIMWSYSLRKLIHYHKTLLIIFLLIDQVFVSEIKLKQIETSSGSMLFEGSSVCFLSSFSEDLLEKLAQFNLWNRCTNILVKSPWLLSSPPMSYSIIYCLWNSFRTSPLPSVCFAVEERLKLSFSVFNIGWIFSFKSSSSLLDAWPMCRSVDLIQICLTDQTGIIICP